MQGIHGCGQGLGLRIRCLGGGKHPDVVLEGFIKQLRHHTGILLILLRLQSELTLVKLLGERRLRSELGLGSIVGISG